MSPLKNLGDRRKDRVNLDPEPEDIHHILAPSPSGSAMNSDDGADHSFDEIHLSRSSPPQLWQQNWTTNPRLSASTPETPPYPPEPDGLTCIFTPKPGDQCSPPPVKLEKPAPVHYGHTREETVVFVHEDIRDVLDLAAALEYEPPVRSTYITQDPPTWGERFRKAWRSAGKGEWTIENDPRYLHLKEGDLRNKIEHQDPLRDKLLRPFRRLFRMLFPRKQKGRKTRLQILGEGYPSIIPLSGQTPVEPTLAPVIKHSAETRENNKVEEISNPWVGDFQLLFETEEESQVREAEVKGRKLLRSYSDRILQEAGRPQINDWKIGRSPPLSQRRIEGVYGPQVLNGAASSNKRINVTKVKPYLLGSETTDSTLSLPKLNASTTRLNKRGRRGNTPLSYHGRIDDVESIELSDLSPQPVNAGKLQEAAQYQNWFLKVPPTIREDPNVRTVSKRARANAKSKRKTFSGRQAPRLPAFAPRRRASFGSFYDRFGLEAVQHLQPWETKGQRIDDDPGSTADVSDDEIGQQSSNWQDSNIAIAYDPGSTVDVSEDGERAAQSNTWGESSPYIFKRFDSPERSRTPSKPIKSFADPSPHRKNHWQSAEENLLAQNPAPIPEMTFAEFEEQRRLHVGPTQEEESPAEQSFVTQDAPRSDDQPGGLDAAVDKSNNFLDNPSGDEIMEDLKADTATDVQPHKGRPLRAMKGFHGHLRKNSSSIDLAPNKDSLNGSKDDISPIGFLDSRGFTFENPVMESDLEQKFVAANNERLLKEFEESKSKQLVRNRRNNTPDSTPSRIPITKTPSGPEKRDAHGFPATPSGFPVAEFASDEKAQKLGIAKLRDQSKASSNRIEPPVRQRSKVGRIPVKVSLQPAVHNPSGRTPLTPTTPTPGKTMRTTKFDQPFAFPAKSVIVLADIMDSPMGSSIKSDDGSEADTPQAHRARAEDKLCTPKPPSPRIQFMEGKDLDLEQPSPAEDRRPRQKQSGIPQPFLGLAPTSMSKGWRKAITPRREIGAGGMMFRSNYCGIDGSVERDHDDQSPEERRSERKREKATATGEMQIAKARSKTGKRVPAYADLQEPASESVRLPVPVPVSTSVSSPKPPPVQPSSDPRIHPQLPNHPRLRRLPSRRERHSGLPLGVVFSGIVATPPVIAVEPNPAGSTRSPAPVQSPSTALFSISPIPINLPTPRPPPPVLRSSFLSIRKPEIKVTFEQRNQPPEDSYEDSYSPNTVDMDNNLQVWTAETNNMKTKATEDARKMHDAVLEMCRKADKPPPKYILKELIGKGSYGRVYKSKDVSTGAVVSVKIIDIDESDTVNPRNADAYSEFLKEVNALKILSDNNARNINHVIEALPVGSAMWMVTEFCAGGSIATLMKPTPKGLSEKWIIPVLREVAEAIKWVHQAGIIHRDIKCANVLVTEQGGVQLCDFGVAGIVEETFDKRTTVIGTMHWMAPEMFTNSVSYGKEIDIWAFGCMAYEVATGLPPNVGHDNDFQTIGQKLASAAPRLEGGTYSEWLRDLVAFCLEEDPIARPSIEQIQRHPYIHGTSSKYPMSSLSQLVRAFMKWEQSGGIRKSLFMSRPGVDPPSGTAIEENGEWNFATSSSFSKEVQDSTTAQDVEDAYGRDAIDAISATEEPPRTRRRRVPPHLAAPLNPNPLLKVFDPNTRSNYDDNSRAHYGQEMSPPVFDAPLSNSALPLRDDSARATIKNSIIDLDGSVLDAAFSGFRDETIKPAGRRLEDEDDFGTMHDFSRPALSDPADANPNRRTQDWKFPSASTMAPPASADPELSRFPSSFEVSRPPVTPGSGARPALIHHPTEPVGNSFGGALLDSSQSTDGRKSIVSLIDLDMSMPDTYPEFTRPSTANSDVSSSSEQMTSGNPFEFERHASYQAPVSRSEPSIYVDDTLLQTALNPQSQQFEIADISDLSSVSDIEHDQRDAPDDGSQYGVPNSLDRDFTAMPPPPRPADASNSFLAVRHEQPYTVSHFPELPEPPSAAVLTGTASPAEMASEFQRTLDSLIKQLGAFAEVYVTDGLAPKPKMHLEGNGL